MSSIFMNSIFKYIYHNTVLGKVLIYIYHESKNKIWPDKWVIKHNYRRAMRRKLDLKNPKSLNEKINWLKLYDRRPIHTICADKYKVREYITKKIGDKYLVPLLFETKNPEKLLSNYLPEHPFVIKTNHDSGGVIIVYDKKELDYGKTQEFYKKRLKNNYYNSLKEWQYKNIEPRIIIEKLLLTNDGNIPMDYKVHCFNGEAHMIQVDIGRDTQNHYRNWYYPDWSRCPFKWTVIKKGKPTDPAKFDVNPPKSLTKMLKLSNILAEPFAYVRIDWYDVDGKLYFGEITFHHDSGCRPIEPEKWDYLLGDLVDLNIESK